MLLCSMTFYPKGCPGSNQPGVPRQASRRYQTLRVRNQRLSSGLCPLKI